MNRYLLLCALALGAYFPAFAQQQKLVLVAMTYKDQYGFLDSTSYIHSGQRHSEVRNADPEYFDFKFDIATRWHKKGSSFSSDQRWVYKYDNLDRIISEEYQDYDTPTNNYIPRLQQKYIYNASQSLESITVEDYQKATKTYIPSYKTQHTYDQNNRIDKTEEYVWDVLNSSFYKTGTWFKHIYDNAGNLAQYQYFYDNLWHSTNTYQYDANGRKISDSLNYYGANADKIDYTYYQSGLLEARIEYDWNNNAAPWIPKEKKLFFYDGNSNCTEIWDLWWKKATTQYDTASRNLYTYSAANQLTELNMEIWENGNWKYYWGPQTYYYLFPVNISQETSAAAATLSLYPIPATTYINLDLNFDKPQSFSVIIFDMQGRMVKQFVDKAEKSYHKNIPVQDMLIGQYILQVTGGAKTMSQNFTIVR